MLFVYNVAGIHSQVLEFSGQDRIYSFTGFTILARVSQYRME